MNLKLIIGLTLIGLVVLFVVQNATVVEIRLLLWTLSMSRALLIFFVLAVGVVVGWILRSHFVHKAKSHGERP